jgi:rhodanese-related sulfurtransferase
MISSISAKEAAHLRDQGAIICDIRSPAEYAAEHIDGARNVPLAGIDNAPKDSDQPLIFCCFSGARTAMAASRLAEAAGRPAYILDGGLRAWKSSGLPVAHG